MKLQQKEIYDLLLRYEQYVGKYEQLKGFNSFSYALLKNYRLLSGAQKKVQIKYNEIYERLTSAYKKANKVVEFFPFKIQKELHNEIGKIEKELTEKYSQYELPVDENAKPKKKAAKPEMGSYTVNGAPAVHQSNIEKFHKEFEEQAEAITKLKREAFPNEFTILDATEAEFKEFLENSVEVKFHILSDPELLPDDFVMNDFVGLETMIN